MGKLLYLLLETNRFDHAKCTIWENSKFYVDKVGCIQSYIVSGKLAEISNCQYLYDRNVERLSIKGLFKNRIDITMSCEE